MNSRYLQNYHQLQSRAKYSLVTPSEDLLDERFFITNRKFTIELCSKRNGNAMVIKW